MQLFELFENFPGKRVLVSGVEAIVRGIFESGVKFTSIYPETPLNELREYLQFLEVNLKDFIFNRSLYEKFEPESCIVASEAGGVILLFTGDFGQFPSKYPIIEPATVQECIDFIKEGLKLSELYKIPIYFHVSIHLSHSYGIITFGEIEKPKDIADFKIEPLHYNKTIHELLGDQKKTLDKITELARNNELFQIFNKIKIIQSHDEAKALSKIGIITSGICYSYVIQACRKLKINTSILKHGLRFPINIEGICNFIIQNDITILLVIEEFRNVMESFSKDQFFNFCDIKKDLEIHNISKSKTEKLNTDIVLRFLCKYFKTNNKYILEEINKKEEILEEILPKLPKRDT